MLGTFKITDMKLSDKLKQLQQEVENNELTSDGIDDGFNRVIEDAEYYERKFIEMKGALTSAVGCLDDSRGYWVQKPVTIIEKCRMALK